MDFEQILKTKETEIENAFKENAQYLKRIIYFQVSSNN